MTTNNELFNAIAEVCKNSGARPVSYYYSYSCSESLSEYSTLISTQSNYFYPQFIYFIDEKEQIIYMERGNGKAACQMLLKFNDNQFRFDSYAFPSDRDPDDYDEDNEDDVKFWDKWNDEHKIEIYGSVFAVLKLFEDSDLNNGLSLFKTGIFRNESNTGPKYEFTGETKRWYSTKMYRIRRLTDGKLGGWIESEDNLSQEGNCWVDDNAMVAGEARVYGNAQVYGDARVAGEAKVYDNAQVYGNAIVQEAKVYGNACVFDNAQVDWRSQVYDEAKLYDNAHVWNYGEIYGNAQVYGNAIVYQCAKVYGEARVYDKAKVINYAQVYGSAKVCGDTEVDGYKPSSSTVEGKSTDESTAVLKDFVYKIDDSSKLDVQSNYESVDAFFNDDSDDSYVEHECLTIVAVDTKVPILKLEKTQVKEQNVFKFIVDITNEDGDDYIVRSVIDSKDKFDQLLQSSIDSLRNYPQFNKYADDLENCI